MRSNLSGPPWLVGFASEKQYEAYDAQREREKQRREDRERWRFDRLPTAEEMAEAEARVGRQWICAVEGHDWKHVEDSDGYAVEQCYVCDAVRFIQRSGNERPRLST